MYRALCRARFDIVVAPTSAGTPDFADFQETVIHASKVSIYSFLYNHWWPIDYDPEDESFNDRHIETEGVIALEVELASGKQMGDLEQLLMAIEGDESRDHPIEVGRRRGMTLEVRAQAPLPEDLEP